MINKVISKAKNVRGAADWKMLFIIILGVIAFSSTTIALNGAWTSKSQAADPGSVTATTTKQAVQRPQKGHQAVFLTNGQVYFGIVTFTSDKEITLRDVYYLQSGSGSQTPGNLESQGDVKLVKLGAELHGPDDVMHINKDHVMFVEDLKDDSKVLKAIKEYEKKQ